MRALTCFAGLVPFCAFLLSGCTRAPGREGPVAASKSAPPRLQEPNRPHVTAEFDVSYAELPVLQADPAARGAVGPSWRFGPTGYEFIDPNSMTGVVYWVDKSYSVLTTIGDGDIPRDSNTTGAKLCSPEPTSASLGWEGFVKATRTAESLEFRRYEGGVAAGTCSIVAAEGSRVVARAVVPGIVYAFRDRTAGDERLVLVGPAPFWSASSDIETRSGGDELFGVLAAKVERGSSATVTILSTPRNVCRFLHGRSVCEGPTPRSPGFDEVDAVAFESHGPAILEWRDEAISFSVEIVWPEGDETPTASAFVAHVAATESALLPPTKPDYTFIDGDYFD
jgi:hypothetical protein